MVSIIILYIWYWSIRPFWYWLLPILCTCIGKILYYEYFGVLISSVAKLCYFAKNYISRKLGKTRYENVF
jgi:hypothetical protein